MIRTSCARFAAATLATAIPTLADGLFAGYGEHATNRVEAGTTAVQAAPIAQVGDGAIYKLGEGTWEIPENVLRSPWSPSIGVLEGSVSLTASDAAAPDVAKPTAVLEKAALWLDASAGSSLATVSSNGCTFVDRWLDVRDAGASAPAHLYAEARHDITNCSPESVVKDGTDAVWFGGLGSGRTMNWLKPDGGQFSDRAIRHVFCVHGIDKTWGYLFGTLTKSPYFANNYYATYHPKLGLLWGSSGSPDIVNARTCVNGVAVNPQSTQMQTGFQLLDIDMGRDAAWIENFFNDRDNFNSSAGYRVGGDYICECVAFTNVLTDVERVQIQAYLMDKWLAKPDVKSPAFALAAGASAEVPCAYERSLRNYTFGGSGTLRKTGGGVLNLNSKGTELSDTAVKVEAGTVVLNKTYSLALAAGDSVAVTTGTNGPRVTVTANAPAGTIVKTGGDSVVLRSLPLDLAKLDVRAGEVVLTQPSAEAAIEAADAIEIPVPNGGFEEWDGKNTTGYYEIPDNGTAYGWTVIGTGRSQAFFYRRASGKKSVSGGMDCMAWPVEGDSYFVLRFNSEVYTSVSLPAAGTYELSFWAATRTATKTAGHPVDIYFDDTSRDVSVKAGRSITVQDDPFYRQTHRVTVDRAGSWRLRFKGLGGSGSSTWGATFLDDIRLRRVPERQETCWKIPGGDFENVTYAASGDALAKKTANVQNGWTLAGSGAFYMARGHNGGTSGNSLVHGHYYNDSRFPAGGFTELYFEHNTGATDATATTTFRPPAGTWVLAGEMAGYRSSAMKEQAWATVEIGGTTHNLGTNDAVVAGLMATYSFPQAFTVDGSQDVTLVLGMHSSDKSYNDKSGLLVDDLRLIPGGDGLELVRNGGFENGATGWTKINTGTSAQTSTNEKVMDTISANWTLESCEGIHYHVLAYSNMLAQAVTFPSAGHYRLSWHSQCRYDARTSGYAAQRDPDIAWIARGGVTNVIGRGLNTASWFTQHTFDFDVPEAGEYTFALQGTNGGSGSYAYMTQHLIDNVSIKRVGDSSAVSTVLPKDLELSVAAGARVQLGFSGVNKIARLRLGGESVTGTVSAKTHPDYFFGTGELLVEPRATVLTFR